MFGIVSEGETKNLCCRGGSELQERKLNWGGAGLQTVRKKRVRAQIKAMRLNQEAEDLEGCPR